jgi:hypothetical protein
MSLDLTVKWTDEMMDIAKFFARNEEIDLTKFCENLIDDIDFDTLSMPDKEEHYKNNSKVELVFSYDLREEDCYFKNGDGAVNVVKKLDLKIPASAILKEVTYSQVMQL